MMLRIRSLDSSFSKNKFAWQRGRLISIIVVIASKWLKLPEQIDISGDWINYADKRMDSRSVVGVWGATSPIGQQLLEQLVKYDVDIVAFTRGDVPAESGRVRWLNPAKLTSPQSRKAVGMVGTWFAVSPIWILPQYFDVMNQLGCNRIVCLSSTSQFTKLQSSNRYEEETVKKLVEGERAVAVWSEAHDVNWTVLRPTLIYGRGNDRNLSEIVKLIRKLRFFPLLGEASGLRQPIYVDDVATACIKAAFTGSSYNKAYNISGAEQLSYKEMVARTFMAVGLKPRFLRINLKLFEYGLRLLKLLPRYRNWNADMVLRMNRDMVFDHQNARVDFGFDPRPFVLTDVDVQS